ncbi:MAG: hypothetical protein M1536_05600 [Firmicutes bacterium]|nr:hypothetical protein [Bacillota bacterium]
MTKMNGVSGVPMPGKENSEVALNKESSKLQDSKAEGSKDIFKKSGAAVEGFVKRGIRGTVEGFEGGIKGVPKDDASKVGKLMAGVENVLIAMAIGGLTAGPLGAIILGTSLGLFTLPGGLSSAVIRGATEALKGAKWGWNRGEYVHSEADSKALKLEVKNHFDLNPDPAYLQKKHDKILQDTYNYFDLNK